jgi:hypothetical protein
MKAGLRLVFACLAATLAFSPAPMLAQQAQQDTPPTTTNTPATDAVGPRALQNFNLSGRVTRPADQPAATAPAPAPATQAPARPPPAVRRATSATPTVRTEADQPRRATVASVDKAPPPASSMQALPQPTPSGSVTVPLPQLGSNATPSATPAASSPGFAPEPKSGSLAPSHGPGLLPWLLAAIALGTGGLFLFWRSRSREAFAGGPRVDSFTAPEPAPQPIPQPAPRPAPAPPPRATVPAPSIPGTVSTRLRPWIEIGFQPVRCIVDDAQIAIEFEAELFNSGSAAARAVLAEASLFNAGPNQDEELGLFFANPVGAGERIVELPPLKRVALGSKVVVPLAQVQRYDIGGKQVFVPVIAFNALYRWSGGEGQTSASYLVGRGTNSEKLGPFRLDLGPRVFRGLAARVLPAGLRQ